MDRREFIVIGTVGAAGTILGLSGETERIVSDSDRPLSAEQSKGYDRAVEEFAERYLRPAIESLEESFGENVDRAYMKNHAMAR